MSYPLSARLLAYAARAERTLADLLPASQTDHALHAAMHYSVLNGGKRIRPMLVYAAHAALDSGWERADGCAASVEMIHAYSLVHDDLPAMDDDALRRGRPTCHVAYGEATAILAGDALQALAFEVLAADLRQRRVDAAQGYRMLLLLAEACGSQGMAGGQAIDLACVGHTISVEALEHMHQLKTGALIRASVLLGALCAGCTDSRTYDCLGRYAQLLGLMFQIRDDLLDVEGDTQTIGKPQGSDQAKRKPTYPAILGLERTRDRMRCLHEQALEILDPLPLHKDDLRDLADYAIHRTH